MRVVNWVRGSVGGQMAVACLLFMGLFIFNLVVVFSFISNQEADGGVINVAGRQRMLS